MSADPPIWRIKYLPKILDEVCGRDGVKERLKNIIAEGNFPHLLFVGSEGIGKTTIARLFSKEFLGRYYEANFKVVYADVPLTQEERKEARSEAYVSKSKIGSIAGKKITTPAFIQVKVKPFVQLRALGGAAFKILIVKNFEALGSNQQGFRRLMEIYGSNCRMILITTKISGIIDPIVSRCQLFLISQVDFKSFEELIKEIINKEGLELKDDNLIRILYKLSDGRISRAIDLLQLCSMTGKVINETKLYDNSKNYEISQIAELLKLALSGDFAASRDLARNIMTDFKYSAQTLFLLLLKELKKAELSRFAKYSLIGFISDADYRVIDGRDDEIQVSALLSKICLFSENLG